MSLQLNHHHQQIYQALKNTSRHNIPIQPIHTPLLNPCPAFKQKYQTPPSLLHSEMLQHYQNEIVRNATDRRRLQFRDFVAEKIKKQQLSKQMEAQHHNLQILGKIDRLKKQRLMLFSQRRTDKQNNQDCSTYGKANDQQQRPMKIERYPNSGKKYTRDHSVQMSREIARKEVQDKTLFSQLRSKELSKEKQHNNVDIERQKQKIMKNNQIVSQISHKIQNMQSYLTDNNGKATEQQPEQPQGMIKDNQKKEKRADRVRILVNPIDKYHIQDKNSIKAQDSFAQNQTINRYSSYLNNGKEDTISNTNYEVDKYNIKMSKQYEYNQKLAEKIRNRWNVNHNKPTPGLDEEGSISLPKNNFSAFALQSSELVKNRPNSKLQYLRNYANLGNPLSQQKRGVKNIEEYMTENKIRDELLVRNRMFNQFVERGGIKGLHVQDRLLDSSIFNNTTTIDNSDIPKDQLRKNFIEDKVIPTENTKNKKSILKNKIQRTNSKEAETDGSKRVNKNNSARSGRSRSSKSRERQFDSKDKRNKSNKNRRSFKKARSASVVPETRKIKIINEQNKKQKDQTDYDSDRYNQNECFFYKNQKRNQRNSNRSQIMSRNKQVAHNFKNNTIIPTEQLSTLHKNNENTIQKIQKRVRLSMTIFEDSQYRNIIHEKNHLGNTYAVQKSLRQELIQKLCHGAEDLIKCKRNRSRNKNHRSFVL